MIDIILANIYQGRKVFSALLEDLNSAELNKIPQGFNNNIAWNFGHIAVTTLALCYQRTGVNPGIIIPLQANYGKGTRPTYFIENDELQLLTDLAFSSIDQIASDLKQGKFEKITSFSTSTYGLELKSIEDVLTTCLMHDNLHLGYAMAQKRKLT